MAAPEDWTGQRVQVRLDLGGGRTASGVLEGVSDRGIVVQHQIVDEGERPVFYPWPHVHWIYPTAQPAELPEDPAS